MTADIQTVRNFIYLSEIDELFQSLVPLKQVQNQHFEMWFSKVSSISTLAMIFEIKIQFYIEKA